MSLMETVPAEYRAQAAKDLRASAEHIGYVGWTQGRLVDSSKAVDENECPVCALGSINWAAHGNPQGFPAPGPDGNPDLDAWEAADVRFDMAEMALALQVGAPSYSIALWNDAPGRSKAEVVSAMLAAAAALEAAE